MAALVLVFWAGIWQYKVYDTAKKMSALEGEWLFSHVRTPAASQKVLDEWVGTKLTFGEDKCTLHRLPEVSEFRITFAAHANAQAMRLDDVRDQTGPLRMLYAVEGDTLLLSYLLHGAIPESLEHGIVVVFDRHVAN